jgi:Mg/Co/Ni transporter MgtE
MTTDYISLSPEHTVGDAIDRLRSFEGPVETVSTIYLVDSQEKLVGSVPLVSLVLAPGGTRLSTLTPDHVIYVEASAQDKDVAEMFDKYNLLTLPVVDEEQRLAGLITADDVISLLRDRI